LEEKNFEQPVTNKNTSGKLVIIFQGCCLKNKGLLKVERFIDLGELDCSFKEGQNLSGALHPKWILYSVNVLK
jgi:hypothetical protein